MNELVKAQELINEFCIREYGNEADFSDLEFIGLAYTEVDGHYIQVYADLIHYVIVALVDDGEAGGDAVGYDNLDEMIECGLEGMTFEDLIRPIWRYSEV